MKHYGIHAIETLSTPKVAERQTINHQLWNVNIYKISDHSHQAYQPDEQS